MAQRRPKGTIYLLHFNRAYHHAQHYIGWTTDLDERLKQHFSGAGARLLSVVTAAGISCEVVRTWMGSRSVERRLKNQKNARRLCPVCAKRSGREQ